MKNSQTNHIVIMQSLLISLAISGSLCHDLKLFVQIFLFNFFIFLIPAHLSWKKVENSFKQAYVKNTHFNSTEQKHSFGGITLSNKDHKGLREFFVNGTISKGNQIGSILLSIILYMAYGTTIRAIFIDENLGYFLIGFSSFSLILLHRLNFWGGYLFFTFFTLIMFSTGINFNGIFEYLIFLGFLFTFLVQLKELNRWYWILITEGTFKKPRIKEFRRLGPIFVLFIASFLITDSITKDNQSLINYFIEKVLSNTSKQEKSLKLITEKFNEKEFHSGSDNTEITAIQNEIEKLQIKPHLSAGEQKELMKLMNQHLRIHQELNENEITKLIQDIDIKFKENQKISSQMINNFKNSTPTVKRTKSQVQILEQIRSIDLKLTMNKSVNTQEARKKALSLSIEKLSLSRKLNQSKLNNIVDLNQEIELSPEERKEIDSLIMSELQRIKDQDPGRLSKNSKASVNTIKSKIKSPTTELTKKIQDKVHAQKAQEFIENSIIQNKITVLNDKNKQLKQNTHKLKDKLEKHNREQKNQFLKHERLKQFLFSLLSFLLFLFILKLFRKKEFIDSKEELSTEKKEEISKLIALRKNKFISFSEEVNYKYKIFYNFIHIVYYSPDFPPPPALISKQVEFSLADQVRDFSHIFSTFFNSVHYDKKQEFSKKDIKLFRKNFNKFYKYMNQFK